jgi:thioester reductase-like protein
MNFGRAAMNYFVTGATGFIGKRLVAKLLAGPSDRLFLDARS